MKQIYAQPRNGLRIEDCCFYHTMDLPGVGRVEGEWSLSDVIETYLGGVDFKGRRVLEVGTASGFLCWQMEKAGADVVCFDLDENYVVDDVIPSATDRQRYLAEYREFARKLNNSFWFCHEKAGLRAKLVYGNAYEIPTEIGSVDICTMGCILLHLRDPVLALQKALRLTKERIIITEPMWNMRSYLVMKVMDSIMRTLMPRSASISERTCPVFTMQVSDKPQGTWWMLPPNVIGHYISILGFETEKVVFHHQRLRGERKLLYTLVGKRISEGMKPLAGEEVAVEDNGGWAGRLFSRRGR